MTTENLKKNALWNAAGNIVYFACQWIVTVFVTVIGGFEDAGALSIAMSMSATFQTVAAFGIRSYQVSDLEGKYTDQCYVFFRIISCAVALIGCISFSLIGGYRGETLLCIFLFMVFRLAENFSDVLHGIAQKNDRLDVAGKSFAIKGIGLLVAFFSAYILSHRLYLGLLAMTAFSCATTLLYDLPMTRRLSDFGFIDKGGSWFSLAKETLPLCAYLFLSTAMVSLPKLILEKQCGKEILGAYASIFAPTMLIQVAIGYVYNPFVNMFAECHIKGDRKGFLSLFCKIMTVILLLALVIIALARFLGDLLLPILFGETIRPYISFLIPILLAMTAVSLFGFLCMICTVLRNFVFLLVSCVIGFGLCIFLTTPFIARFSANGTSYSLIVAAAVSCAIALIGILKSLFASKKDIRQGETEK